MSSETKTILKWFWFWDDEQEEAWLRQMSLEGLHLEWAWPGLVYRFARGEPEDYVYRHEFFFTSSRPDLQPSGESPWTCVAGEGNWPYFRTKGIRRKKYAIRTVAAYRIRKYREFLLLALVITPLILLPTLCKLTDEGWPEEPLSTTGALLAWFVSIVFLFLLFNVLMTLRRLLQLQRLQTRPDDRATADGGQQE